MLRFSMTPSPAHSARTTVELSESA